MSISNEELCRRIQDGETDLIIQLWENVKRFARKTALPFANQCGDPSQAVEDLMQEGYLALLAAIPKYRCRGATFVSVYHFYLLRRFNSWMAENSGPVSIPTYLRERQRAMLRKESELASQGDECIQSTAEALGISADRVQSMRNVLRSVAGSVSLDGPIGGVDSDDLVLGDVIASSENIEETVLDREYHQERQRIVWSIAERYCSDREMLVLKMYYVDGMSLTVIADRLEMTGENVRRIRNTAVKRLRRSKAARDLTERLEAVDTRAYGHGAGISGNSWSSATELTAIRRIEAVDDIVHRTRREDENRVIYMLMP